MKFLEQKTYLYLKRLIDIIMSSSLILISIFPMFFISLLIKIGSKGPIIHWSKRIGKNNEIFEMPKFRTMLVNTPSKATHLLENPESWITIEGKYLRKYSLDELPQLWSIFTGKMSFVGPRPALHNQKDLIDLRTKFKIHFLAPGLTGLAQISGRDELSIKKKVKFDLEYMEKKKLLLDLKIILFTFKNAFLSADISH